MNAERTIADWLRGEAPPRAPDQLLKTTLERIAVLPQERIRWRRDALPRPRGRSRPMFALAATLVALGLIGGLAVFGGPNRNPAPITTPTPVTTLPPVPAVANGWVAYAQSVDNPPVQDDSFRREDIFIVRQGQPAYELLGRAPANLTRTCPAFSVDGSRIAYGQAEFTEATGYANAALVIADFDARGNLSNPVEIPLGPGHAPPCATWSGEGRRIAFVARGMVWRQTGQVDTDSDLWIVGVDGEDISVIPDISVLDMDWSPDGSTIAVVSGRWNTGGPGGPVTLYSELGIELETLANTDDVRALSWSPDGSRLAYQRGPVDTGGSSVPSPDYLATLEVRDLATGDEHVVASGYKVQHGVGPIWSPNGEQIVYQRLCDVHPNGRHPCREQHDVVVLTAGSGSSWLAADVTELVLPLVSVLADRADHWWFPWRVTWSPDGANLLYLAWHEPTEAMSTKGLLSVPIGSGLEPATLVQHDELSVYHDDANVAIQLWGRQPAPDQ